MELECCQISKTGSRIGKPVTCFTGWRGVKILSGSYKSCAQEPIESDQRPVICLLECAYFVDKMHILAFSGEYGEDLLKLACVLPITAMMAYSFPSIACQGGGNPDGRFNKGQDCT